MTLSREQNKLYEPERGERNEVQETETELRAVRDIGTADRGRGCMALLPLVPVPAHLPCRASDSGGTAAEK